MGERLLVVNADDFGLTPGVDRAILRAGDQGIVTSASVLATGPNLARSGAALASSGLGVGAHLTAVGGGPPLLSANEVPSLVDRDGMFWRSWRTFVGRAARGAIDPDDVEREFNAQLEALVAGDLVLTHVDTHQNIHLWPSVTGLVTRIASRHGVGLVRVPRTARRSPFALGVRTMSARLGHRVRAAGLATTEATVGLDEAGALHHHALHEAIERLGRRDVATADIVCHPGEAGEPELEATGWGFAWGAETEALLSPEARAAVDAGGFRLATYAEVARRATSVRPGSSG